MCRFLAYRGAPVSADGFFLRSRYSLGVQSRASRYKITGPLNEDGFGLGWFNGHAAPERFVGSDAAWLSHELPLMAGRVRSGCWFGHIRAASPGMAVAPANSHPFSRQGILWMHNGLIAEFARMQPLMLREMGAQQRRGIQGTTDSETCFGLFLALLERAGPEAALRDLVSCVRQWHAHLGLEKPSYLNIAVTNGRWMFAARYITDPSKTAVSLFLAENVDYNDNQDGIHLTPRKGNNPCVVVASEPLTDDLCWNEVPPQSLLEVTPELETRRSSLP
ncbi:MAG TPA: class II glutamine amidotransferase [Acidobacteriota bacterium]|jgi:predicted glutamine amidotransferase